MGKNEKTSAAIDCLLRLLVGGSVLPVAILAPNSLKMLEKPLRQLFDTLDERQQQRALRRMASYMKERGLVSGSYQHGLIITDAGKKRAHQTTYDSLSITRPTTWDGNWRLVMFDIPESNRKSRINFTQKLRLLGFQPLQQSVWIHPFPSRHEVQTIAVKLAVAPYVTYIETSHIDHGNKLCQRFAAILPNM